MAERSKQVSGVVTGDPANDTPIGTKIQFHPTLCLPVIAKGAGNLQKWDHFGSILLAITYSDLDESRADGSAVLIGPGLALAARHVFDPAVGNKIESTWPPGFAALPTDLLALKQLRAVAIEKPEALVIESRPEGGMSVRYTPWT